MREGKLTWGAAGPVVGAEPSAGLKSTLVWQYWENSANSFCALTTGSNTGARSSTSWPFLVARVFAVYSRSITDGVLAGVFYRGLALFESVRIYANT